MKAAEQGDVESQNDIGISYEKGEGVDQDPTQALIWFEKAAKNGNIEAQYNAALKYYSGGGVIQNYDKSIKYAKMAASNGNKPAVELLLNIYSDENNPKYNPEKANYWKSKLE